MIAKMQITPFKKSGRCLEGIDFSKYQRIISHSPLIEYICYAPITYTPAGTIANCGTAFCKKSARK